MSLALSHGGSALSPSALMADGADLNDDARGELRWAAIVAFLFFGLFLGWAGFVRLDAAAHASGNVAVAGNRQVVQHRDGGTVSAIRVREGQRVKAGDVLIELGSAEVVASERALSAQLMEAIAIRAALLAERSGGEITTPAEFLSLQGDERALADRILSLQRSALAARRRNLGDQQRVLGQQTAQLGEQINGIQQRIIANKTQDRLLNDEVSGLRDLAREGYVSLNRLRAQERSLADLGGQTAALRSSAAATREQIGAVRMQALTLTSQRDREVSEQLRDTNATINDIQPRWLAARKQLEGTRIRATATGQVVGLSVFTVGGVIAAGQKLMEIVPDKAALSVEAQMSPNDADDLRVGQVAEVRFPALHDRTLPVLHGTVSRVSADALRDERTGAYFYSIAVTVPERELAIAQRHSVAGALRPGIPAEVLVPLRARTMLDYLFEPFLQLSWLSFREH